KTRTNITASIFTEIRRAPIEYQEKLKRKAIAEALPRDGVRYLANRLIELNKNKSYNFANELLKKDFAGMETPQLKAEAERVSLGIEYLKDDKEFTEQIEKLSNDLIALLEKKPLNQIQGIHSLKMKTSLMLFVGILVDYLGGKGQEVKKLLK
ncbi:MAG: hypothetical protein AABY22_23165, partial [Nanoarchaeota archaeon]